MADSIFPGLPAGKPILIAGPCSAESYEQLLETAKGLQIELGLTLFRAGAWKPRTSPGSFEGFGEEALEWLRRLKKETGLLVGTEIGNASHARLALSYGMDFVWIGTRTTGSPFAVEEIAAALQGSDIAVFVKNPMAPDLDLWAGAIGRLLTHGIKRVGAILRGFYVGGERALRNLPFWHLSEEFRTKIPASVPLICDPSHIAGKAELLPSVIREAGLREMDGLIIETHAHPECALTDRAQQITPHELAEILRGTTPDGDMPELARLRGLLDKIDEEVIRLLRERFAMTDEIGEWKAFHSLTPHQEEREKELYETRKETAKLYNVSPELAEQLFKLIHAHALSRQEKGLK